MFNLRLKPDQKLFSRPINAQLSSQCIPAAPVLRGILGIVGYTVARELLNTEIQNTVMMGSLLCVYSLN